MIVETPFADNSSRRELHSAAPRPKRAGLWLAEQFVSIQGEGRYAGTPSVFIRTSGCNLRCWFCDSAYTSWHPEGRFSDLEQILQAVEAADCRHVVLTGGEPLLQPDIVPLSQELTRRGYLVTVETAGTIDRAVEAHLMSISPKRQNSAPAPNHAWRQKHLAAAHRPAVIQRFISQYDYQLKFVVDVPLDLNDIEKYLLEFPQTTPDHVWLMPQGISSQELQEKRLWLEPAAVERGFHYCPRTHIELFGHQRGT